MVKYTLVKLVPATITCVVKIKRGLPPPGILHSVKVLVEGSNLPILFVMFSVNHIFPDGSEVIHHGPAPAVGTFHSERPNEFCDAACTFEKEVVPCAEA